MDHTNQHQSSLALTTGLFFCCSACVPVCLSVRISVDVEL